MNQLQELMSAVGRKRFIILAVLAVICAGLGFTWQKILLPKHTELTSEIARVQSERSKLQKEITELPIQHALLEETEKRYTILKDRGFFVNQDRIVARTRMDTVRAASKLHGISYKIEPQKKVENSTFTSTTDEVVLSEVSVEMRGLTDAEALNFIERMQTEFSGLVVLKEVELKRENEVTPENLQKISKGESFDFITGKASFDWYSIIPISSTVSTPLSQAFEGTSQ